MNLMKWWFNRHPYVPAAVRKVEVTPLIVDNRIAKLTMESQARSETRAKESRNFAVSVVTLHSDLLKLIEGHRL